MKTNVRRVFKTYAEQLGNHWHVDVYSAPSPDLTYARLGTLVMDQLDYDYFKQLFAAQHYLK